MPGEWPDRTSGAWHLKCSVAVGQDVGMEFVPRGVLYDYEGICWWCGDTASSREHKWKKSEIKALYGPAGSQNYPLLWVGEDGKHRNVQGPDSDLMKFEKSLCMKCNNSRSQPFDLSYDRWIEYVTSKYDRIVETRVIDLRDVVDEGNEEFRLNLAKYFAKHIGCRVADNAGRVPESLIRFLNGESADSSFAWTELCLSNGALEQYEATRQMLGMPATVSNYSLEDKKLMSLKGALMHGALQLVWDINLDADREDNGDGVLPDTLYLLRGIDDDLYRHRFLTF